MKHKIENLVDEMLDGAVALALASSDPPNCVRERMGFRLCAQIHDHETGLDPLCVIPPDKMGRAVSRAYGERRPVWLEADGKHSLIPRYSSEWDDGGELIALWDIDIKHEMVGGIVRVKARVLGDERWWSGEEVVLVAVCRAMVAHELGGGEVELPE